MKCQSVQIWLMQVESLHVKDWPRNMNRHFKKCPACAKTARALYRIEEAWRSQPVPDQCDQAKTTFLAKLPTLIQPTPEKRQRTSRRQKRAKPAKIPVRPGPPYRWFAAAAVLFIGIILTGLLLPSKTQASSDVVERLIDWNLEMTTADAKERKRLLDEHEASFRKEVQNAQLPDEERKLAEELLDFGRELANAEDEVVAGTTGIGPGGAEIVQRIADKLFARAEASDKPGKEKEFERCGMRFVRFKEHGYEPMKARIAQYKFPEPKKGFEKGGHDKKKWVEKFLERPPEQSRPDLHRKLEEFKKAATTPPKKTGGKR